MTIRHTPDQSRAISMLSSDSRYIELRGGARSGKTVLLVESMLLRAWAADGSRHLVARFRGNSLGSIFGPTGTFFWVLKNTSDEETVSKIKHNGKLGFYLLPNGSEIWYGGLDDPKRVDKLLGQEYCTIYCNEASQIPYGSFTTILTRLAQNARLNKDEGSGHLRQRCYVDDNPPGETHWLALLFQRKLEPLSRRPLANPMDYTSMILNPEGNRENLDPAFLESLKNLPERQRKRFYEGKNGDAGEAALWTSELIDQQRVMDGSLLPQFSRIVVAVDPSGADNVEDATSDEIGIAVTALGQDGTAYALEDLTMKGSPAEWGKVVVDAYDRWDADCVVAEGNFGGAMVKHVIQTAATNPDRGPSPQQVPYQEVTASRGKHIRAEPVSGLWEARKVKIVGRQPELEDELVAFTTAGYSGTKSPNRADAHIWGITALFPRVIAEAKRMQDGPVAVNRSPRVNLGHAGAKKRWRR